MSALDRLEGLDGMARARACLALPLEPSIELPRKRAPEKWQDEVGVTMYGEWLVIGEAVMRPLRGSQEGSYSYYVHTRCRCRCGVERDQLTTKLRNGQSRSCGCVPHGYRKANQDAQWSMYTNHEERYKRPKHEVIV